MVAKKKIVGWTAFTWLRLCPELAPDDILTG
jgi:hypothetical protein